MGKTQAAVRRLLASLILLSAGGCAINTENSSVMPGVNLSEYRSFYVIEEEDDRRGVGRIIVTQLQNMALSASIGSGATIPEAAEILVRYQPE